MTERRRELPLGHYEQLARDTNPNGHRKMAWNLGKSPSQKKPQRSMRLENAEPDNAEPFGLTEEQADTDRLLRRLLGTALADRYADFCRLSGGRLPLTVSRPLAGHAMRELDSWIRHVLAVPMDARAVDDHAQMLCRRKARRMLKKMGFDDGAVQRAGDGLKPKFSHKTQIERITGRLGLAADSDVAKLWIELNDTYGRVHERSFHERLEVDDAFRAQYSRRFDTVIRTLALQLQDRYAALMRRAKEIAGMPPAEGIKLFVSEIPGAIQLRLYFYENLASDAWLPFLEEEGLLQEPLPDVQISGVLPLWAWPVGRYLIRMAASDNAATRKIVGRALRALKSSTHPDVQRLGLEIIAALPADEAATLADLVDGWLTPELGTCADVVARDHQAAGDSGPCRCRASRGRCCVPSVRERRRADGVLRADHVRALHERYGE